MKPIALDAMGGDYMPAAAVKGAIAAAKAGIAVSLVGDQRRLAAEISEHGGTLGGPLSITHAADVIQMSEQATNVRRRPEASVMVAMDQVKSGAASAAVSFGHSGATMAAALLRLGRMRGVERPAILANVPHTNGFSALIDAGANTDCRPSYLAQFAVMGSVYAEAVWGITAPKVGLMSIGEEPGKGNELVREAYPLLAALPNINFYGNIEGRDVLAGLVDVIVTDGFTGNVILKLAEGEAKTLFGWIRTALTSSLRAKIGGALVKPALKNLMERVNPNAYGAQPLLGVDGYAFIGHGSADSSAVLSALQTAHNLVQKNMLGTMRAALAAST